jgi:mRNA interferase YafQ
MRAIERTSRFKRDFKREQRGSLGSSLQYLLVEIITALATDAELPERCRDHALTGNWIDYRDCHVRPDLVLIYPKPARETLQLVRLGSHAELGL